MFDWSSGQNPTDGRVAALRLEGPDLRLTLHVHLPLSITRLFRVKSTCTRYTMKSLSPLLHPDPSIRASTSHDRGPGL